MAQSDTSLNEQFRTLFNIQRSLCPALSPLPLFLTTSTPEFNKFLNYILPPTDSIQANSKPIFEFFEQALAVAKTAKKCNFCETSLKQSDERQIIANTSLDIPKRCIILQSLKVACMECLHILNLEKVLSVSCSTITKIEPGATARLSEIFQHFLKVNSIPLDKSQKFQDCINIAFALRILIKTINWKYISQHKTLDSLIDTLNPENEIKKRLLTSKKQNSKKKILKRND